LPSLESSIQREILRLELGKRVVFIDDPSTVLVNQGTDSITSPVPYVLLERGGDKHEGRRERLDFEGEGGNFALLARRRTPPAHAGKKRNWIGYVTGESGRELPVTVADPKSHTIHVLVDLERSEVIEGDVSRAAAAVVAVLVGRPLELILAKGGRPSVGRRVPHRLRALLQRQGRHSRRMLEREVAVLRRLGAGATSPRYVIGRRLALVEAALEGKRTREVELAVCERESQRLGQLLESRACASLQVDADRIRGLLNPRLIDESWGVQAFNFSLWPAPELGRPELALWAVGRLQPPAAHLCIGPEATEVLRSLEDTCNVFGLIDTVLNFVETNKYGRVRSTGEARRPVRHRPARLEL
jgi:hypothetical protein